MGKKPADYTTFWSGIDVALGQNSLAIDAGQALPNINDGFSGGAPDLGALEFGGAAPTYGVREPIDTLPPAAPQNVSVQ